MQENPKMIRLVPWLLCLALLVPHPVNADEQPDARAIIDSAIKFAGGREALACYEKPFVRSVKATAKGGRGPEEYEIKTTTLFPDKYRTYQTGAKGGVFELVLNGEKGWHKSTAPGGAVRRNEMIDIPLRAQRERLYAEWLSTLLPLDDEDFRLSMVKEIVIDGRPAVEVNISCDERSDVQLYFDRETFAPVKVAFKVGDRVYEKYYDDYAELDGLVYPKKETNYVNGNKVLEMQTSELKFLDSVEDKTFQEP